MARLYLGAGPTQPNDQVRYQDVLPVPGFGKASGDAWVLAGQDSAVGTVSTTQAREVAVPFLITTPVSILKFYASIVTTAGSAGALLRLGIRAHDAVNSCPANTAPLLDAGTQAATATGTPTWTLGSALVLGIGWYWATLTTQGAPATPPTIQTSNGILFPIGFKIAAASVATLLGGNTRGLYQTGVTGALPSTWATSSVSSAAPRIAASV